jgi:hypothetical protein
LKPEELLGLDVETVLHRLFWEEPLLRLSRCLAMQVRVFNAVAAAKE